MHSLGASIARLARPDPHLYIYIHIQRHRERVRERYKVSRIKAPLFRATYRNKIPQKTVTLCRWLTKEMIQISRERNMPTRWHLINHTFARTNFNCSTIFHTGYHCQLPYETARRYVLQLKKCVFGNGEHVPRSLQDEVKYLGCHILFENSVLSAQRPAYWRIKRGCSRFRNKRFCSV